MTRRTAEPPPGIAARYPGTCPICKDDINPGDRIVKRRGEAVHCACFGGQDE